MGQGAADCLTPRDTDRQPTDSSNTSSDTQAAARAASGRAATPSAGAAKLPGQAHSAPGQGRKRAPSSERQQPRQQPDQGPREDAHARPQPMEVDMAPSAQDQALQLEQPEQQQAQQQQQQQQQQQHNGVQPKPEQGEQQQQEQGEQQQAPLLGATPTTTPSKPVKRLTLRSTGRGPTASPQQPPGAGADGGADAPAAAAQQGGGEAAPEQQQQQPQQQHDGDPHGLSRGAPAPARGRGGRPAGPLYASEAVGRRCAILRCSRGGGRSSWWEKAKVVDYDSARQQHKLLYMTDGRSEEWMSLLDVKFKWEGPPPPGAAPSPTHRPELDGDAAVGRRLRVYWPAMQRWYAGQVKSYDGAAGRHKIFYRDGDAQDLCLRHEPVTWLDDDCSGGGGGSDSAGGGGGGGGNFAGARRRPSAGGGPPGGGGIAPTPAEAAALLARCFPRTPPGYAPRPAPPAALPPGLGKHARDDGGASSGGAPKRPRPAGAGGAGLRGPRPGAPGGAGQPYAGAPSVAPGGALSPGRSGAVIDHPGKASLVGCRVSVFWRLDKVFYRGRLTSFSPGGGKFTIKYDDGQTEQLLLERERVQWHAPRAASAGYTPERHAAMAALGVAGVAPSPVPPPTPLPPGLDAPPSAEGMVGWKVAVWFGADGTWQEAEVLAYDEVQQLHLLLYLDGEHEWADLGLETIAWQRPPRAGPDGGAPGVSAGAIKAEDVPKGRDAIGWRVAVFWRADRAFAEGQVVDYEGATGRHRVLYADDEEETLNLRSECVIWRLSPREDSDDDDRASALDEDSDDEAGLDDMDEEDETSSGSDGGGRGPRGGARRRGGRRRGGGRGDGGGRGGARGGGGGGAYGGGVIFGFGGADSDASASDSEGAAPRRRGGRRGFGRRLSLGGSRGLPDGLGPAAGGGFGGGYGRAGAGAYGAPAAFGAGLRVSLPGAPPLAPLAVRRGSASGADALLSPPRRMGLRAPAELQLSVRVVAGGGCAGAGGLGPAGAADAAERSGLSATAGLRPAVERLPPRRAARAARLQRGVNRLHLIMGKLAGTAAVMGWALDPTVAAAGAAVAPSLTQPPPPPPPPAPQLNGGDGCYPVAAGGGGGAAARALRRSSSGGGGGLHLQIPQAPGGQYDAAAPAPQPQGFHAASPGGAAAGGGAAAFGLPGFSLPSAPPPAGGAPLLTGAAAAAALAAQPLLPMSPTALALGAPPHGDGSGGGAGAAGPQGPARSASLGSLGSGGSAGGGPAASGGSGGGAPRISRPVSVAKTCAVRSRPGLMGPGGLARLRIGPQGKDGGGGTPGSAPGSAAGAFLRSPSGTPQHAALAAPAAAAAAPGGAMAGPAAPAPGLTPVQHALHQLGILPLGAAPAPAAAAPPPPPQGLAHALPALAPPAPPVLQPLQPELARQLMAQLQASASSGRAAAGGAPGAFGGAGLVALPLPLPLGGGGGAAGGAGGGGAAAGGGLAVTPLSIAPLALPSLPGGGGGAPGGAGGGAA